MDLLGNTKIAVAIVGAVVLVGVVHWVAADVYRVTYPDKPGYLVPGVTAPPVDLAALNRSWPQALETEKARAGLLSYMRHMPREVASNAPPGGGAAAAPAAPAPEPALDLVTRLARADMARGERTVRKCIVCHTIEKGEAARVGPNLWGVVGRPMAKAAGFSYSDQMKKQSEKTANWVPDELDIFLTKPQNLVPGTRMTFPGLPDQQERADVIAYLNAKSDSPLALPKNPG
jgi:cytochrome c